MSTLSIGLVSADPNVLITSTGVFYVYPGSMGTSLPRSSARRSARRQYGERTGLPRCHECSDHGDTMTTMPRRGKTPIRRARSTCAAGGCWHSSHRLLSGVGQAPATTLTIQDGVVVKFGTDAGMTVRETLRTGEGVRASQRQGRSVAGQAGTTPQTASPGDWRGLRIDPFAVPANITLDG